MRNKVRGKGLMKRPAGDSLEQRQAERWLVHRLGKQLNRQLTQNQTLELEGGVRVNLDAFCESPLILCEVWAHLGALKGSQSDKVLTDAMKLVYVSKCRGGGRRILVFGDESAARPFVTGKGWKASCLRANGIEVIEIPFSAKWRKTLEAAQRRQRR